MILFVIKTPAQLSISSPALSNMFSTLEGECEPTLRDILLIRIMRIIPL